MPKKMDSVKKKIPSKAKSGPMMEPANWV